MPLGTYTWGAGTNVAVFSRDAVRVWLELYDDNRNEIGWWIWDRLDEHDEIHRFVKELIAARMAHSPLRHGGFYTDESLQWVGPEGQSPRWDDPASRALGCYVPKKEELAVLLLFNAGLEPATFELPPLGVDRVWQRKADTSLPSPEDIHPLPSSPALDEQERYTLSPRTSVVLIAELTGPCEIGNVFSSTCGCLSREARTDSTVNRCRPVSVADYTSVDPSFIRLL